MSEPVKTNYTYVSAWLVHGGVNLSKDRSPQELYCSEQSRFVLTTNLEKELEIIDRRRAIGNLLLNELVGHGDKLDFHTELEKLLNEIRAERQKLSGQTVLLAYGYGSAVISFAHSTEIHGHTV